MAKKRLWVWYEENADDMTIRKWRSLQVLMGIAPLKGEEKVEVDTWSKFDALMSTLEKEGWLPRINDPVKIKGLSCWEKTTSDDV